LTFAHHIRIAVVAVVAALVATTVVAPSASAGPRNRPDHATVTGVHFEDLQPADIVQGIGNDMVLRWTAGQQLTDGTVRITFPGTQWATPLTPFDAVMDGHMPAGTFSVRPYWDIPIDPALVTASPCAALPGSDPPPFGVERVGNDQVIVISHVTCAPGQSLAVLLEGIQAPASVDAVSHAELPITAMDPSSTRHSVAWARIMATPRVRLEVDVPDVVTAGVEFFATVRAVRPDGGPARNYRGTIALTSSDCAMQPINDQPVMQFGGNTGRVIVGVTLRISGGPSEAHHLQAYDIANKAQPGVSNYFDVGGSVPSLVCPVSYH
jgi:hypothetical protein